MNGFIYKITNRVNNKVYIGQTRFTIEHRFKQHLKNHIIEHKKQPLYLAFEKYGTDNFYVEKVEEVPIEKLSEREIYWIAKYDSFKNGYNATIGGEKGGIYIWTDSNYEEMKNMYLSGFTIKNIAYKFNVSHDTINGILKSLNVKLRRNPMAINRIEKDLLIERYKNGVSLTQLGKELNTDRETIKRFLIKNNVPIKEHSAIICNKEVQKSLIEDFLEGIPFVHLEKKYNADARTIKKVLTINGIDYKSRKDKRYEFKIPEEVGKKVVEEYKLNYPLKSICKKYNIKSESTIYEILKRYNVKQHRYNCSKSVLSLKANS